MVRWIGCLSGYAPGSREHRRCGLVPDLCRLLLFYLLRLLSASGPPVLREDVRRSEVRPSNHD
jgi:hypothetical protein